ncbi:hypothetical protein BC826DRAFT_525361 [Russula brevipes]|nr:hypothetical protein BC826DRAFT_525361 [Russula brevipes]
MESRRAPHSVSPPRNACLSTVPNTFSSFPLQPSSTPHATKRKNLCLPQTRSSSSRASSRASTSITTVPFPPSSTFRWTTSVTSERLRGSVLSCHPLPSLTSSVAVPLSPGPIMIFRFDFGLPPLRTHRCWEGGAEGQGPMFQKVNIIIDGQVEQRREECLIVDVKVAQKAPQWWRGVFCSACVEMRTNRECGVCVNALRMVM